MRQSQESLERLEAVMRRANPVPHPSALVGSATSLAVSRLLNIGRQPMDRDHTTPLETRHRWRGPAIAVAALAAALVIALPLWFVFRGEESAPVVTEPTVVTTTMLGSTTTIPADTTSTTAPTTATTVPPIERLWASPGTSVAAVSAEEAWAFGGEYYWSGIGHFLDGAWTWAWFTFDSDLWAFTGGDGFAQTVSGLAMAPDGTWWVAGPGGVFSWVFSVDGVEWTRRFDYAVSGVAVAPDGTVWIGGVDWLARWDGGSWVSVSPDSPEPPHIPEDSPWGAFCGPGPGVATSDGEVWMVGCVQDYAYAFRLLHYDGATLWEVDRDGTTLRDADLGSTEDTWPWYTWLDVEAAPNGDVWTLMNWYETDDRRPWLLGRFDGEVWTTYTPPPFETYHGEGPAMAVGPDRRVWFALEDGLLAFDGTDWTYHLQGQTVTDVDVAPDGTVWYIDQDGAHILDN